MAACPKCMRPAAACICVPSAGPPVFDHKVVQHPNSETQSIQVVATSLLTEADDLDFAVVVFMDKRGTFGHALGTGREGAGSGDILVAIELVKDFVMQQVKSSKG